MCKFNIDNSYTNLRFFVLSGYLMCMLLSRHEKIGVEHIFDFYFRRIKRIVPIYLFLILVFQLTAILWWLSLLDYNEVYTESIKPLFFVSNINSVSDYFDRNALFYKFFSHLWSLAVEMQFYLIVPFLMIVLGLARISLRFLFITLIALLSFALQLNLIGNEEHMSLFGRVWQFMFGFIAFYITESINYKLTENKFLLKTFAILSYVPIICLVLFLSLRLIASKAITRLILLSSTVLILIGPDYNHFLCNKILTEIGDVSYSVYIVHWMLFEWHRYWALNLYLYNQKLGIPLVIVLILTSIMFGYLIEKGYLYLRKYITNWKTLISIISVLYLMIFISMLYLKSNGKNIQVGYRDYIKYGIFYIRNT